MHAMLYTYRELPAESTSDATGEQSSAQTEDEQDLSEKQSPWIAVLVVLSVAIAVSAVIPLRKKRRV